MHGKDSKSYPYHVLPKDILIRTFYNSVLRSTRDTIDVAAGGSLIRKTIDGAFEILEKMANKIFLCPSEWKLVPKQGGKFRVNDVTSIHTQLVALTK